ncbi:ABC transporter substrate-binding protein [Paenibacillus endoradicis]|uniref:ABC transporter substrate-binding protein n=1 Tax=Paenibacillus endoradicis TaxID=2972487 RepID=UPI002158A4D2|nr:sugar ABC transporter substrate-binding protein [Paenibacillus endoradicis]MCR8660647.1 sugar ABC transporter substrate-binding protein [Paenibacillus endoradicis]
MKKNKKVLGVIMVAALSLAISACSSNSGNEPSPTKTPAAGNNSNNTKVEELDYTFGEGQSFHSNEPVKYSLMYSDHEAYPQQSNWRLWSAISEKTNVSFELATTARTEYENQKSLLVNSGDAPYIIPKTYEEAAFVPTGQIVAISDWVQYMPNYSKVVKDWGMEKDLKVKLQADGKYYVLPGMWEVAGGGYSYIIRKDVFEAAGVDVKAEEGNWTYESFYEAMKKVKEFTGADYVLSDQFKGDSTLNIAAVQYGVTAGWGAANGMRFDHEKQQFEFANTTNDFKDYVTYFNKLVTEGIMDPESFTQEDDAARAKFFKGDSYVINGNYQLLADYQQQMQVDAELYMIVQPGGPKGMQQIETSRLENGVMISQNALNDLGEEEFIKMLRFVDWLWYSDEGQTLSLWGVEGETYTKDAEGTIALNSDISWNGLNVDTATKKLNVDFGFGNGVFAYGGTSKLKMSKMTEGEKDYNARILEYRVPREIAPPIMGNADQSEQMNLISTPMMDYVKTMTLKFITGQEPLANFDSYVKQVEANGSTRYVEMSNEIFNDTKSLLGY